MGWRLDDFQIPHEVQKSVRLRNYSCLSCCFPDRVWQQCLIWRYPLPPGVLFIPLCSPYPLCLLSYGCTPWYRCCLMRQNCLSMRSFGAWRNVGVADGRGFLSGLSRSASLTDPLVTCSFNGPLNKKGGCRMLEIIAIVLIILWLLGLVSSYSMGGLIHILLVIAVVVILIRVIQGRRI